MTQEQELRVRAEFSEVLEAARVYAGNSDSVIEPWRARGELGARLRVNLAADTRELRAGYASFSNQVLNALNKLADEGFLVKVGKNQPGPSGGRISTARFYRPELWERLKAQAEAERAAAIADYARWQAVAAQLEQLGFGEILPQYRPQSEKVKEWERLARRLSEL